MSKGIVKLMMRQSEASIEVTVDLPPLIFVLAKALYHVGASVLILLMLTILNTTVQYCTILNKIMVCCTIQTYTYVTSFMFMWDLLRLPGMNLSLVCVHTYTCTCTYRTFIRKGLY